MVLGTVQTLIFEAFEPSAVWQAAFYVGGEDQIQKIKEKKPARKLAKEKIQAAPKELFRRGLLTGTEKLKGQLRDANQGGRREDTEADHAQNAAQAGVQRAAAWVAARPSCGGCVPPPVWMRACPSAAGTSGAA